MLGQLPKSLIVNGTEYEIRSDFRNILTIFDALEDPDLTDEDKAYVLLRRVYVDLESIPKSDFTAAYQAAVDFIEGASAKGKHSSYKLFNWRKDEQMIFPAVNKVAGCEVRLVDYMHWWTFLGYFSCVDREDLWSFVLSIRQKRAKGKKLEKYEREFYNANRELCSVESNVPAKKAEDTLKDIFNSLLEGGDS